MDNSSFINKIKALAERGATEGEREAARIKLAELMKKYNIAEADVSDDAKNFYYFSFKSEREWRILLQVVYKVTNAKDRMYDIAHKRKTVAVKCTAAQNVEIGVLYEFYVNLYKKEEERLFDAFVQKHELFGKDSIVSGYQTEMSLEDKLAMIAFMEAMENAKPLQMLNKGVKDEE